ASALNSSTSWAAANSGPSRLTSTWKASLALACKNAVADPNPASLSRPRRRSSQPGDQSTVLALIRHHLGGREALGPPHPRTFLQDFSNRQRSSEGTLSGNEVLHDLVVPPHGVQS